MITHELARDMVKNNIIEWFREELLEYISQQEKVTELLGLYRKNYNKIPIGTSLYKVELEIERLEKELGEMK